MSKYAEPTITTIYTIGGNIIEVSCNMIDVQGDLIYFQHENEDGVVVDLVIVAKDQLEFYAEAGTKINSEE